MTGWVQTFPVRPSGDLRWCQASSVDEDRRSELELELLQRQRRVTLCGVEILPTVGHRTPGVAATSGRRLQTYAR